MKQIGDLRSVCEKCEDWKNKKCGGCFVGFGGRKGDDKAASPGDKWDRNCSTICRDEEIAVGMIKAIGLTSWGYRELEYERPRAEADKGSPR